MAYFNYHAKAKKLIKEGHLLAVQFFENYHNISPAMVLYFDNENPMSIREHRFEEYINLINNSDYPFKI